MTCPGESDATIDPTLGCARGTPTSARDLTVHDLHPGIDEHVVVDGDRIATQEQAQPTRRAREESTRHFGFPKVALTSDRIRLRESNALNAVEELPVLIDP